MKWDENLLQKQKEAASYFGSHARLLAGPGTGKTLTLTRRIAYLFSEKTISADNIQALTFTRAATKVLRDRVKEILGDNKLPTISTLHSFALRQLLKNEKKITALPQPLRIADDWEERNIIQEDLKKMVKVKNIIEIKSLFNNLSADWQSLSADNQNWENQFPNPQFLGAWREHRKIYGYTLRSELVYQLKKALEQCGNFELDNKIKYLIVDEYQDLNACDLDIIRRIESMDIELFIAGDDDQSIYGFRKADPQGIRNFPNDYHNVKELSLNICKRCDENILTIGQFVADQDYNRIQKNIKSDSGGKGEVKILRFRNQTDEAYGIAKVCKDLINKCNLKPEDILILLRSDHKGRLSRPIIDTLINQGFSVNSIIEKEPFDTDNGRIFLAFMRLGSNLNDNLAWRTLLQKYSGGFGDVTKQIFYDLARNRSWSFAETILKIMEDHNLLPSTIRNKMVSSINNIINKIGTLFPENALINANGAEELLEVIKKALFVFSNNSDERQLLLSKIEISLKNSNSNNIIDLMRILEISDDKIEQDTEKNKINIMTMHKAKGLTSKAIIIAAAEDEYIPGKAVGADIDDQRRLLYVSLTRAQHYLFVTYCDERTNEQRYTGRNSGKKSRTLTQFLRDYSLTPIDGFQFISTINSDN